MRCIHGYYGFTKSNRQDLYDPSFDAVRNPNDGEAFHR